MARVSVMVMIGSCKNRIMRKFNFKGKMSALDAYKTIIVKNTQYPLDGATSNLLNNLIHIEKSFFLNGRVF